MAGEQGKVRTCDQCSAVIPREQFLDHTAVRYKGKLLCPKCVQEVKAKLAATKKAGAPADAEEDPAAVPIALVEAIDEPRDAGDQSAQIHGFSGAEMTVTRVEQAYKRPLLKGVQSATRCRTFHCKMTDASFQNLNEQINEWADEHEDIEIKFAISSVGVVEGKHADPHLIITVFY
jgi:uncharacterized Zn finger protein (UPF0148 family)